MTGNSPWIALAVEVPEELEDDLAGALGIGSLGVETSRSDGGGSRLTIFFGRGSRDEREEAARILSEHGLDPEACRLTVLPVEDGRWVERYQSSLRPLPLGERFVVIPDGSAEAAGPRDPIRLVPGRAFGTGEHPTTRLCAAALERLVREGSRWLDLGTGSGILAVVAARCGAGFVEALDDDPEAVEVAREVVEANGVAGRVRVRTGTASCLAGADLDGCVANVAGPYFLGCSPDVAAVLSPGGALVCSGFLGEDAAPVSAALAASGLVPVERLDEGPWCLLVARLRAGR